jgi:hypothetical protein
MLNKSRENRCPVAYQSNESGQFEVYVRPFPAVNDYDSLLSTRGVIWRLAVMAIFPVGYTLVVTRVRPGYGIAPVRQVPKAKLPGDVIHK